MKQIFKNLIVAIITAEAKIVLRKYKPKIVAITGSVGKTSTKDAIAAVLSKSFRVRKSQKSYNSEVGVPLVVFGCETGWLNPFKWISNIFKGAALILFRKDYPEWLVLELGVERPKDMENLVSWLRPQIAAITALAEIPVHVEFFSGPEALIREKAKILKNLKMDDFAILNGDDEAVFELKEKTRSRVLTFGFGEGADLLASNYRIIFTEDMVDGKKLEHPEGISFKVDVDGKSIPIRIFNAFGRHQVYPALAALAVGQTVGLNLVDMGESLSTYESPPGRLKLIKGEKRSFILDDTYNSSPLALMAALDTLRDLPAKRKIAVLGDMLELGKYTIEVHKSMAKYIIDAGVDIVFAVGPRARFVAEGLREKNFSKENIFEFSTSNDAKRHVEEIIDEGDIVLVKGSQSMRMERVVEEIMAEPERAGELLVRQEKAWQNKN